MNFKDVNTWQLSLFNSKYFLLKKIKFKQINTYSFYFIYLFDFSLYFNVIYNNTVKSIE